MSGLEVTSHSGVTAEVMPLSCCMAHGWTPHHVGTHGSLTCRACTWDAAHGEALNEDRGREWRATRAERGGGAA